MIIKQQVPIIKCHYVEDSNEYSAIHHNLLYTTNSSTTYYIQILKQYQQTQLKQNTATFDKHHAYQKASLNKTISATDQVANSHKVVNINPRHSAMYYRTAAPHAKQKDKQ